MPQFNNQIVTRRLRRIAPTAAQITAIADRLLALEARLEARISAQPKRHRHGLGTAITRNHERAVMALMEAGVSRAQAARQIGISRSAVSLIAAGKYPFGADA